MKEVIYVDDIQAELDMSLVSIPFAFKNLFVGTHFKDMKELNEEIRCASYCNIKSCVFGATPVDRRNFIERMNSRKRT